jgi:3-oxoacyl-[acyl-carrier protein] reductase
MITSDLIYFNKYQLPLSHKFTKMLAIITGASKGIGYELVKEFSKNSQNLVIAISRNTQPLLKLMNAKNTHMLLPVKADLSKNSSIKKVTKLLSSLQLPVDILINNAGQLINKPFEKINAKELQTIYSVNVFAPFLLSQAVLPFLNKKNRAHIVNIGSMGGFQGTSKFPGLSAYTSSKGALTILTECMAEEFKDRKVSVNCLAIGSVQTEMLAKAFPGYKAPVTAQKMAEYICSFAQTGQHLFNGKVIPVSSSTP